MPEINSKVSRYNTLKLASRSPTWEWVRERERDGAANGREAIKTLLNLSHIRRVKLCYGAFSSPSCSHLPVRLSAHVAGVGVCVCVNNDAHKCRSRWTAKKWFHGLPSGGRQIEKKKALISLLPKFYVLCAFNFSSCLFSHTQLFIVCFFSVFSIAILIGVALVVCLPPAPPSRLHHTIYALHIILSSKFPPVCFFAWSLYLYFMCCLLYAV